MFNISTLFITYLLPRTLRFSTFKITARSYITVGLNHEKHSIKSYTIYFTRCVIHVKQTDELKPFHEQGDYRNL